MTDNFQMCLELTEELEKHKKRINQYKQKLKRKEQECEELQKIINEAKNSKLDLNSFLVGEAVQNEYEQQLDQLKAELEQEKNWHKTSDEISKANSEYTAKLKQTLTEIKEIAKPYQRDIDKICGYCRKYDSCHACCIDDLKLYEYRTGTTKACERFVELERFNINIVANKILQKISECEVE